MIRRKNPTTRLKNLDRLVGIYFELLASRLLLHGETLPLAPFDHLPCLPWNEYLLVDR